MDRNQENKYYGSIFRSLYYFTAGIILSAFLFSAGPAAASATIPVGDSPEAVAVNPVTNQVFVANFNWGNTSSNPDSVTVIDMKTGATLTTIAVGPNPTALAVNTKTNRVYVANMDLNLSATSGTVTVIDMATGGTTSTIPVGLTPFAIAVNPANNRIYVANSDDDSVSVIDGSTDTVIATVGVGTAPEALAVNPSTNSVYVANTGGNNVSVIDAASTVTATLAVGSGPRGVTVNPANNKIYVANAGGNNVTIIDGAAPSVLGTVPAGAWPATATVNAASGDVYVANFDSNNVTVISGTTDTAIATIATGTSPNSITVNAATNRAYTADYNNGNSGTVTVIDGSSHTAIATLPAGSGPYAIGVDPVADRVFVTNDAGSNLSVLDGNSYATSAVTLAGVHPVAVAIDGMNDSVYVLHADDGAFHYMTIIDAGLGITPATVGTYGPVAVVVNPLTGDYYVANRGGDRVVVNGNPGAYLSVGTTPVALGLDEILNRVYVANSGSNDVSIIDGVTKTVIASLPVGANPSAVGVNRARGLAYVVNKDDNTVSVISGITSAVTATVVVGPNASALAVNERTGRIYVVNTGNDSVTMIDSLNSNQTTTIAVGTSPAAVSINEASGLVYVANAGSDDVSVISGLTDTVLATVPVGTGPNAVAVNAANSRIYVSNGGSDNVSVIDGPLSAVTATVSGLSSPSALAVNPKLGKVYVANTGTNTVTVIDEQDEQSVPLTSTITPLANNFSSSNAPTFTIMSSSTFTIPTTVQNVYYQFDSLQGTWLTSTPSGTVYLATAPTLTQGMHILYAFAVDGQDATSVNTGYDSSPLIGTIAAYVFTIDTTVPTISVSAPSAVLAAGGPVTYTVTYSDGNFNASTLAPGNVTLNKTGSANASIGVSGTGSSRTVTLSSITGDGTLGISLAAGTATDLAGNMVPSAGPSALFSVDNTAPATTVSLPTGTYDLPTDVTLTCNDGTGSGCASTSYCFGSGCTSWTVSTSATTTVTIPGTTVLRYYATDNAGNNEAPHSVSYTNSNYQVTAVVASVPGTAGTITPTSQSVASGGTVSFIVTPTVGTINNVTSSCGGGLVGNKFTTGTVTSACTVTATFANQAPGVVSIITPTGVNSQVTTTKPALSVTSSIDPDGDTVSYVFEVYSSPTYSAGYLVESSGVLSSTTWTVTTALSDNTLYFWRAQATDGYMNSAWTTSTNFFVNTVNDPPAGLSINYPAIGSSVTTTVPTLIVNPATDPDIYDTVTYQFFVLNSACTTTSLSSSASASTSWTVSSPLVENTEYCWKASATDNHGLASWVTGSFFVNTANTAPTAPTIASPADGSQTASRTPALTVNNGTDVDRDTLQYVFEIDVNSSFTSTTGKQTSGYISAGTGSTSWTPGTLADNTLYYWHAKANDGQADSPWSATASLFINTANDAPSVPVLNSPANNGQVTSLAPTLSVYASTDPDIYDTLTYEFAVYTSSGLTTTVTSTTGVSLTSWTVPQDLSDNTWYWWRAQARDNHGLASGWSAAGAFFVNNNGTNDPPGITITKPGVSEPIVYGNSFTISWTAYDPDSVAVITLGYDTTGAGCSGTQIATGISENDGPGSYAWNLTNVVSGVYYVYASITDGTSTVCAYGAGPVTRSNTTGDVNNDGTVDSADALQALLIAAGIDTPTADQQTRGDVAPMVNGVPQPDGKIDIGDVVVILRKAVGLVSW